MNRRRRRKAGAPKILALLCLLLGLLGVAVSTVKPQEMLVQAETVPFEENQIEDNVLANKYYYQQLGEEEQIIYKELLQGLEKETKEVYVHGNSGELVNQIFESVLNDNPQIFWCDGGAKTTTYEQRMNMGAYAVVEPSYIYTEEERLARQQEIDTAVEALLQQIPSEASEYDKIKSVFEILVNQTDYNMDAPDNQNIYSVFVNRQSVCAGYSKATQYLLERLSVFCTYVTGTIPQQGAHAWNLVLCDGNYYYVDTTWGDPVFLQEEQEGGVQLSNINYDYLCCSDTELFKTHTLDEGLVMPICSSMDKNYYLLNGMYYEAYDYNQLLEAMNETIYAGGEQTVFKFASAEVYNQAHDPLITELVPAAVNNLADIYDLSEVDYSYAEDPDSNKFTVLWKYE